MAAHDVTEAAVTFATRLAPGITRKVAIGRTEDDRLGLDFNIDYDFTTTEITVDQATAELLDSLRSVEQAYERIQQFVATRGRVKS